MFLIGYIFLHDLASRIHMFIVDRYQKFPMNDSICKNTNSNFKDFTILYKFISIEKPLWCINMSMSCAARFYSSLLSIDDQNFLPYHLLRYICYLKLSDYTLFVSHLHISTLYNSSDPVNK